MKTFGAIKYYFFSFVNILFNISFWTIPLLLTKSVINIRLKNGFVFVVKNLLDIWTIKEVVLDNCYKYPLDKRLNNVIDIGASICDFPVYASKNCKTIYAYEISEKEYYLGKKNLGLNKINNVVLFNSDAYSIDKIFQKNNLKSCDFLKIDCEGNEYKIFSRSSDHAIKKIRTISGELHLFNDRQKNDEKKLLKRLNKLGFKVDLTNNPVHRYLHFLYALKT